jgi:hypothetical protein
MSGDIPNSRRGGSPNFQRIVDAFLLGEGLPFSSVLSAERIERVFAKHGCTFGLCGIYNAAITLWAFLGQVLRDGEEASCQSAVARVVCHCLQAGLPVPSSDTGAYCRARAKLSEAALHELSCEVAADLEESIAPARLWKGRHTKLIDGFTFTMPGTAKNQKEYPHPKTQKAGVGLPIARCVAILSLATAAVMDAAIGPYSGKETGESALLRKLLGHFSPGDIAVMDRYYCSFMMIALLLARGTDTCTRRHHLRHFNFQRGRRLGKYDHIIEWTRPARPKWMDKDTYAQIPETLQLREIRFSIVEPGKRTHAIDIITTLIDPERYTKEDIAELYGFRWNSELDIRSIKDSLNLAHVRCQSPKMVRREFWTTILGYNLIRSTAARAAVMHGKLPRQISFTGTCQYVLGSWAQSSDGLIDSTLVDGYRLTLLQQIATCEVANRPGRLEPRVIRRRPNSYDLMQKPRNELKAELRKHCT